MSLPQAAFISESEYLAGEKDATVRHEYVDGRIYAMSGASKNHIRMVSNLSHHIRLALGNGNCLVATNDLKVRMREQSTFYYPDVVVTCDPDESDPYYTETPCFIAEVLSPSTETTDRREKLLVYRGIPTLRAYLLADSRRHAEYFIRDAQGVWRHALLEAGDTLCIACEGFALRLTLDQIYEQLDFGWRVAEEPARYASA